MGPELVANGGFDTGESWILGDGWTIADGKATFSHPAEPVEPTMKQTIAVEADHWYRITYTISNLTGMIADLTFGEQDVREVTEDGTYTDTLQLLTSDALLTFNELGSLAPGDGYSVDNVSVREVFPGGGVAVVEMIHRQYEEL